ncbi:hypothetical protein LPJ77_004317 [Coemansia sp. RSA 2523]|nr:hypothetical protein LPJ77_004317 [Coemansia sp. RSA 2523]KAJ2154109.1 hypothetical protein J3F82_001469 [Coemansia sp. RSA 637]KAJ2536588.1 hypothetical protein IWW43_000735 [Coemansia sp. RSA 1935]
MYLLLNTLLVLAASTTVAQGSIVAGYAPSWKNMTDVDLSQYTHINLAYAEPLANGSFVMEASYNMSEFANKIQKSGGQPLLALGGWSGSIYFSDILKSTEYRKRLITGIVNSLRDNKLAGVDIDWVANECNKLDVHNDAANLLIFLKELRSELESAFSDAKKLVALGVGMTPFLGPEGPLKDVSEYAKLVDYINVLAYDVNGPYGDSTGPNAPLKFQEGKGAQASLASAIDGWTEAKFPASQITAGLAFYGRAATAKSDMTAQSWNMYQSREAEIPRGDNDDGLWTDRCNSKPPHFSGVWSYSSLHKQGVLEGAEVSKAPWQRYWDNSTTTPWLYNPNSKQFISYDDPPSITAKANYVSERGLAGVSVFDITMDHNGELIAAVRKVISTGSTPPTSSHEQDTQTSSESSSTFSSSSANSGSASSTTTSAESTPSPDNHNKENTSPRSGGNCGNKSQYRCMKEDGKDSEFAVCSAGVWILQHCGTGTTCVQSGDYIYCDWPR